MLPSERVTFFGNIRDTKPREIRAFIERTNHLYGGIYPSRETNLSDEEVVRRSRKLLVEAGVPNDLPLVLCSSNQERARQVLQSCMRRSQENGTGLYWIIDQNPNSFAEVVKSMASDAINYPPVILKALTVIKLGSTYVFDHLDPDTGMRLVSLQSSLQSFPVHPTPAS